MNAKLLFKAAIIKGKFDILGIRWLYLIPSPHGSFRSSLCLLPQVITTRQTLDYFTFGFSFNFSFFCPPGFCVVEPAEIRAFREAFVTLRLPYSVRKHEHLTIAPVIYNYGDRTLQVSAADVDTK